MGRGMASRSGPPSRYSSGPNNMPDIRKALFRSPGASYDEQPNATETLKNKLQIEHDVESSWKVLQKDLHDQRIKDLRQLQKTIAEDDWRYTPIEKLIGLH